MIQFPLAYAANGLPAGVTLTPQPVYGTALVEWTPTAADVGTYAVDFTVQDDGNAGQGTIGQDSRSINIVVHTANRAPILAPIGNQSLAEQTGISVSLSKEIQEEKE